MFDYLFKTAKVRGRLTLRRHEQVDAFENVEEELVASVLETFASPTDLASHLRRDLTRLLLRLKTDQSSLYLSIEVHYNISHE